jgi:hypothetical protein
MVSDSFDDSMTTGIANGKAFGCPPANEDLATCRTVEANVANDDVLFRFEGSTMIRVQDDSPAGKSFAYIVIGISFEF